MRISLVVATAADNVIGKDGKLPWHLPEDLRHFKALTMGKPVIMGRRTFESIGCALPGRLNIVITRQAGYRADGCEVVRCPADALTAAGDADEVMVIGGGEIYAQFLRRTDRIYRTRVDAKVAGDTRFPPLDPDDWELVESESFPAGEGRDVGFVFEVLDRKSADQR